jgi:hypothetical protein
MKKKAPQWADVPDEKLEAWAQEGLQNGGLVRALKKNVPQWANTPDDKLEAWAREGMGQPATPSTPEDEIKRGIQERKVGIRNAQSGQRVGSSQETMARATAQTSTDAAAKKDAQQVLAYGRAPEEEAFVKEYIDFDEMMKANPGAVARSIYGEVQAQNPETGQALGQLRPGRSAPLSIYKDSKWYEPALGVLGNVTDVTGKAAAKVYRGMQYPWLPHEARPKEGENENEGFSELLQNESGKFGKAFPQVAAVGGAVAALPAVGWNTLMVGKNKAEQALAEREVRRQEYLAKQGAAPAGPYNMERAQQDLATQKQDLAKEDKALDVALAETQLPFKPGDRTPEEGADIGRNVLGKRLADIAGLVNPLQDVNLALKGIGLGGKALLATKTGKAVGREMGNAAEALAEWSSKSALPLSNFPAKVGAPEATRAGLESAQSLMREFPAMEERKILEQYQQLVTPEQAKKAIRSWHTPEARTAAVQADPAMANVFETLQPLHSRIALEAGIKPQDYSPFHIYGGQDASQAAREGRTASQLDEFRDPTMKTLRNAGVDTAGVEVGSARVNAAELPVDVTNIDVPGLRSLRDKEELWSKPPTEDGVKFLPGARTSDSYAQRLANRVAGELTKIDDARDASRLPGFSVWRQKASGALKDDYDLEKMVSDAWSGDAITGMAGTHRKLMEKGPQRLALAREELLASDYMVKAAREDFGDATMRPLSEWSDMVNQERVASGRGPMSVDTVPFLNAHGDVRTIQGLDGKRVKELVVPNDIRNRLLRNDEVIIVPRGPAYKQGESWRDFNSANGRVLVMDLPEGAFGARREAMVVPRRVASALDQLSNPNAKRGVELAKAIDHALGLSQAAYAVTRGNPGFDARNFQSNATRALIDEGPDFLSGANRAQSVRDLADPALRLEAEKLLGIGKDLGENAAAYGTKPSAPGLLPARIGPFQIRKGQEKAFNALQEGFGGAINKQVDDTLKNSFFRGAPAHYSADDMLRFHHWRTQMQRGVHPKVAAQNTNRLLINYADKSGAEALAKTFFPFIRFYTGAAQGAVLLALKEPYRFSRIWRLSQAMQQADSDARGGKAVNAKAGSAVDALVGTPMVGLDHLGMGDSALALRLENPLSETKAVFDAALGELAPGASAAMGARPASLLHPGLSGAQSLFADFPVVDEFTKTTTGYAPLPVPNEVWSGLDGWGVPGKAKQVWNDTTPLDIPPDATPTERAQLEEANRARAGQAMRIADSPKTAVLYEALRRIPGVGPITPVMMDTAMRLATRSGNVRGRTSEAREIGALRMLLRMLGPRSEGLDIQEMMGKKGSELDRRRTPSTAESNQKAGTAF